MLRTADWPIALALAAAGFFWFSTHAGFPIDYHPDEPSKVRQLQSGELNHRHPLLLLQTAKIFLWGADPQSMSAREVGVIARRASAAFGGIAAGLCYLAAVLLAGRVAGCAAAALVLTNQHLFELSRYLKEDPALAMAFAAFALALLLLRDRAGPWQLAGAGLAVGLAASAKAVGLLLLPVALLALWLRREDGCTARRLLAGGGLILLVAAAVFLAVNFPMLGALATVRESMGEELDKAILGHGGTTRAVPHGVYFSVFREGTNPVMWLLLASYYLALILRGRRASQIEWLVALLPLALWAILSFFPKTHHRYFLPAIVWFSILAGAGLPALLGCWGLRPVSRRLAGFLIAAILAGLLVFQIPALLALHEAFASDSRRLVAAFLLSEPGDIRLLQDRRGQLASACACTTRIPV